MLSQVLTGLGYTQLTDKLAALGSIDRIKDVLNPPFELIINAVHKRFGSVVKLAGDSAIVVWTIPPKLKNELSLNEEDINAGDVDKKAKEYVCNLALLCCMELLEIFQSYEIKVETGDAEFGSESVGQRRFSTTREQERTETIKSVIQHELVEETSPAVRRGSEQQVIYRSSIGRHETSARRSQSKKSKHVQKLRLHIGLGFGEVQHVFVGRTGTKVPNRIDKTLEDARAEYFVAGHALHDAGVMLNKGKSGQLVFRQVQINSIDSWPLINEFSRSDSDEIRVEIGIGYHELKSTLYSLVSSYNSYEWTEGSTADVPAFEEDLSVYIEPSLKKHLFSAAKVYHGTAQNALRENSVYSDNMNQYRTITVLFLRLPNIPVDSLGSSKAVLEDVQFVADKAITIASKYGGTCRQIHADEKALSVLLVWGIEGFTHEKGDYGYAVSAGMEIEKTLKSRKWCHNAPTETTDQHVSTHNFSLAVTMGKAFCGFIGTENRSEGTVLGPCVNLAARIMCDETCNGRLLCDEAVAEACGKGGEFDDVGVMFAKGIAGAIKLLAPVKMNFEENNHLLQEETVLTGREGEFAYLSENIVKWKGEECDKMFALVIGKSGFGKTEFVKSVLRQFSNEKEVLGCFASARENRNDSNYMYQQILLSLFAQVSNEEWFCSKIRGELRGRRSSLAASLTSADRLLGGSKMLTNPSYLSIATQGKSRDSSKAEFLLSLGIPRRSVVMLQANYPAIFDGYKKDDVAPEESSSSNDSANVLVTVIMTILGEVLPAVQKKVIIYLDDIQWMDSGSFETTFEIINRCPNVFVVMTSRPKEEYDPKLRPHFEKMAGFRICKQIIIDKLSSAAIRSLVVMEMKIQGFDIQDVSSALLKDIGSKSQGNPMVIKLICKYLSSNPAIIVNDSILTHIHGKSQEGEHLNLPLDTSAAVISTLDKLSSATQMILRVASVAVSEIVENLQAAQRHGILSSFTRKEGVDVDFSFHHYLIYLGIYSSILQSRREEIHQLYADYYEKLYESSTSRTFLPALLHHLLKLPGQEFRKIKYLKEAFQVYSDWNRKIEALMYYEKLRDLEESVEAVKKTDFQLAQEQRYLALIRIDATNPKVALAHYYKAFELMGCDMKKSKFKLLLMLLKCTKHVDKMLKSKSEERYTMALKALSKFCKNGFSGLNVEDYIGIITKSKTVPLECSLQQSKIFEIVEEMRILSICAFGLVAEVEPGLELAMIEFLYYFSLVAKKEISRNDLATANVSMGAVFFLMKKLKLANQLYIEAKSLFCDLDQVEISRQGGTVFWCCGALLWSLGEFENSIYPYEMFINMKQKAFGATPRATHFIKIQILMACTLVGNIQDLLQNIAQLIQGDYSEIPQLLADLKMLLAYNIVPCGRFEEAFQLYDEFAGSLELEEKPPNIRTIMVCLFRCHLEIASLSGLRMDLNPEFRDRLTKSVNMTAQVVKHLKTPEGILFPFCILAIPTWLDFILLAKKMSSVKGLFKKYFTAICLMSKTAAKVFPKSFRFAKMLEADVALLHKKVTKKSILRLISTTHCGSDAENVEDLPFLTRHWRARILVRVVLMVEVLSEKERPEIWRVLGDSIGNCGRKLALMGMEHEAGILLRSRY
ncbi:Adenylate cyclase type 10 [Phlyctochytrium planicorne]|nr:Adenylate cyclase type 10 [Phlyctochytrium planicorne]